MQVRIAKDFQKPLIRIAALMRRSIAAETNVAIELHLEANRELLKSGARLPKGKNAK